MAKYLDSTGLATVWEKVKALIPASLKNPYALTIQTNGTTVQTYDGSAAKTVNIAPQTINAAVNLALKDTDLDTLWYSGFYCAGGSNTVTNKPSGVDAFGLMSVHDASGKYFSQVLFDGNISDKVYMRHCNNGTWTSWAELKFTDTTYSAMTGATSSAAGKAGLVPAPAAGKQTSFLRGDGTWVVPTNTTYTAATTTSAGLMSAADKVSMNKLGGSVYYDRTGASGVSRLGLFSVTPVAVTVSGTSLTLPPVVEFETVITSTSSTSSFCTLRGTLCCNSDAPTLIWSANAKSTWFGDNLIKGITYDKTNKQVFVEVNSSSSYVQNLAMRTYIYRADHCTVTQITATTSSTNIKTFTI